MEALQGELDDANESLQRAENEREAAELKLVQAGREHASVVGGLESQLRAAHDAFELLQEEASHLREQLDEAARVTEQNRQLQDEIDELRTRSSMLDVDETRNCMVAIQFSAHHVMMIRNAPFSRKTWAVLCVLLGAPTPTEAEDSRSMRKQVVDDATDDLSTLVFKQQVRQPTFGNGMPSQHFAFLLLFVPRLCLRWNILRCSTARSAQD